jgi:hypothetical protein
VETFFFEEVIEGRADMRILLHRYTCFSSVP